MNGTYDVVSSHTISTWTLSGFVKMMGLGKWNTKVWYRVTLYLQVFCGLMVDQRTLRFWGVIVVMVSIRK